MNSKYSCCTFIDTALIAINFLEVEKKGNVLHAFVLNDFLKMLNDEK